MFGGYSHKLPALLERVASKIAHPDLMPDRFAVHRDIMKRTYSNFFKEQPYQHTSYLANLLLEHKRHHILDYLRVVSGDDLTLDQYRNFCTSVLPARVRVQALCHGNCTAAQAEKMVATACTAFGSEPLAASERSELDSLLRALQLPEAKEVWVRQHGSLLQELQREHANADDTNSAIELFLQIGIDERPRTMMVEMLEQASGTAHPPHFHLSAHATHLTSGGRHAHHPQPVQERLSP
jgi:insulysin